MARSTGSEQATCSFGGCHSIQLSYERVIFHFTPDSAASPKDWEAYGGRGLGVVVIRWAIEPLVSIQSYRIPATSAVTPATEAMIAKARVVSSIPATRQERLGL